MLEFINFLRALTFSFLTTPEDREDIVFENDVAEFEAGPWCFTWDNLIFGLRMKDCEVHKKTPKSAEQIQADLLKAEKCMEQSREPGLELLDVDDYHIEAICLSSTYVVERIDLGDLFRDCAAEAGIIVLDEDKCFDDSILITEKDWDLVVSRVIAKLQ